MTFFEVLGALGFCLGAWATYWDHRNAIHIVENAKLVLQMTAVIRDMQKAAGLRDEGDEP